MVLIVKPVKAELSLIPIEGLQPEGRKRHLNAFTGEPFFLFVSITNGPECPSIWTRVVTIILKELLKLLCRAWNSIQFNLPNFP